MEMIRMWNGDTLNTLRDMLELFGVKVAKPILLKYEALSPDSFIWVITDENNQYCLYAEDYIPSLQHVSQMMKRNGSLIDEDNQYDLLQVKNSTDWDKSSPVTSASVYKPPIDPDEFMKFAVPSGHDFVFLGLCTKSYQ